MNHQSSLELLEGAIDYWELVKYCFATAAFVSVICLGALLWQIWNE